jgi:H+-transporting ATPase
MLALLNDGAILSIAYDNVRYKAQPEAWNMRMVLGISTVLGVIGVVAAFGLFYLGERVFHLDRPHIQTLMYLKLSVAGHLTIFLTRTRGPFWSIRPARILWMAVLGTQTVATLIAVYGVFMTPLGWKWAGFVWGYALIWFLINDRIKLLAYRIFDPIKPSTKLADKDAPKPDSKTAPKPEAKAESNLENKPEAQSDGENRRKSEVTVEPKPKDKEEPKPEAKAESKPEAKAEAKPEGKDEPKPDAKADSKPEIKDSSKPVEKAEPKPEAKDRSKPEAKAEGTPEGKNEAKPDAKAESKPATQDSSKPEVEADPELDDKEEPKPETKTPSEATPQLVKRVHELYEELGREEVRVVEDWEKKEREAHKDAPDKAHK